MSQVVNALHDTVFCWRVRKIVPLPKVQGGLGVQRRSEATNMFPYRFGYVAP